VLQTSKQTAASPGAVPAPRSRWQFLWSDMTSRQARAGYIFLLPSLIILLIFVFWPIVQAFILSLQKWQFGATDIPWVGLQNYTRLFADSRFWNALRNTTVYTLGTVPAGLTISLLLAVGLNQKLPLRAFLRASFFLPVIGSFAIIAIIWSFLLNPEIGLLSYWLRLVGLPPVNWLRDARYAMLMIVLVSIWKNIGFNMVIFLAGLQGIPDVYYEAARVDGANLWARFWNITLPLLRPTFIFVLVISVISSFQVFDQVYVMTPGGGPLFSTDTIVSYIYYRGVQTADISYSASIGVVLFVIVFVLTLIQLRVLRFRELD